MSKSSKERLCAEMELAIAIGGRNDILSNAEGIAARLASRYPNAGNSAVEIQQELIRLAQHPDAKIKFRELEK